MKRPHREFASRVELAVIAVPVLFGYAVTVWSLLVYLGGITLDVLAAIANFL